MPRTFLSRFADHPETCEWIMAATWLHRKPRPEAVHEIIVFAAHNTAWRPTTLRRCHAVGTRKQHGPWHKG